MSFGASIGDILIIVSLAKKLVRNCKQAGGEYVEVSAEVNALHSVLSHLKTEIEDPESILNRKNSKSARDLRHVIGNCDVTLKHLDGLLQKYHNVNGEPGMARLWDRVRFGGTEMDELAEIRIKLLNHKTTLTVFMDAMQLRESGRLATQMNEHGGHLEIHGGQLQSILNKVDGIAARMGQQAGSRMTNYDDDDKEVWKQFRRELIHEGFSSELLHKYKDVLRQHIKELDQKGLLDEMPPDSATTSSSGMDPQIWLKDVPTQQGAPPSFNSLHDRSEDPSMKEQLWREEDTKFLQSMKSERAKGLTMYQDRDLSFHDNAQYHTSDFGDKPSQTSPLIVNTHLIPDRRGSGSLRIKGGANGGSNSSPFTTLKDVPPPTMSTTDLMFSSGSDHEPSNTASRSPQPGPSRLQVRFDEPGKSHSPSISPISMRSQASFADNDRPRRATAPPSPQNLTPSFPASGTSPSGRSIDVSGSAPRGTSKLAPDEYGHEIPPDAKWTRIKRSLVSTEILDQEGMRYEARPDFVAVLGILSRDKIADLAERSHAVREARRARRLNVTPQRPPPPPRPITRHKPHNRHGRDTSSDEDYDEFSSSSEDNVHHSRSRRKESRSESRPHTQAIPIQRTTSQQYPPIQPQGQTNWLNLPQQGYSHQPHPNSWSPGAQSHSPYGQPTHYMPPNQENRQQGNGNPPQGNNRRREPRRGWRDNLAAAGIGGAAASFISVLSETVADLDI